MRVRRGFLNWGVFLICLGAIPLAVQAGVLDRDAASGLLRLWPVLLIGAGVGLVLRFTPLELVGGVIVAATFGVLAGSAIVGGISGATVGCAGGAVGGTEYRQDGALAGGQGTIDITLSCADVDITRAPGQAWSALAVSRVAPEIRGDDSSVTLRSGNAGGFGPGRARESWQVSLPSDATLSANITLNAVSGQMVLGGGPLTNVGATFNAADVDLDLSGSQAAQVALDGTWNASNTTLRLPDGDLDGDLDMNAASLRLCLAPETGLSINYEDTLSSHNFGAAGLTGSEGRWQTTDFDAAPNQVRLDMNANVSTITLDRTGECQ